MVYFVVYVEKASVKQQEAGAPDEKLLAGPITVVGTDVIANVSSQAALKLSPEEVAAVSAAQDRLKVYVLPFPK